MLIANSKTKPPFGGLEPVKVFILTRDSRLKSNIAHVTGSVSHLEAETILTAETQRRRIGEGTCSRVIEDDSAVSRLRHNGIGQRTCAILALQRSSTRRTVITIELPR